MLSCCYRLVVRLFFFFTVTATTEIYTLSLHDALPIFTRSGRFAASAMRAMGIVEVLEANTAVSRVAPSTTSTIDRKSTRLNSSHRCISYAVFCLKKKKNHEEKNSDAATKHAYNDT